MKNIVKHILIVATSIVYCSNLFAQSQQVIPDEYHDLGGVTYSKIVQGPNDLGEYTIYLKSFSTGEVKIETGVAPADIVLVLDYSTSMTKNKADDGKTLLAHLQSAVAQFVQQVQDSNGNVIRDSKGGHRIAFVLYGNSVRSSTGLNEFHDVTDYTVNQTQSAVYYGNNTNVLSWTNNTMGTASGEGMEKARVIISNEIEADTYKDVTIDGKEYLNHLRSKMVIWFTDGDPTGTSNGEETEGKNCITAANTIKNDYDGFVYSIGLFKDMDNPTTQTTKQTTFLAYTSSDYSDNGDNDHKTKTNYPSSRPYVSVSWRYSFITNDPTELANIFKTIENEKPESEIDLGTATTVVDVVSQSFSIPKGANNSDVKVYETEVSGFHYEGTGDDRKTVFEFEGTWDDITDEVTLDPADTDPSTVTVTGWNFEDNMCAVNPDGETARGKQLILEIPIVMNPNAVGGHGVGTNGPGSGIRYTDSQGHEGLLEFETPDLNLPINLHIRKENMRIGESAKFTIQRKWNGSDGDRPATIEADKWYNYTTVFVTRRNNDEETGENAPIVKIVGLHPDYLYRIKEEDWSWSYSVSGVSGVNYDPKTGNTTTVNMNNGTAADWSDNTVTSDQINMNPFIFVNAKKDVDISARHAESIVRNEFKNATSTAQSGTTLNSKD